MQNYSDRFLPFVRVVLEVEGCAEEWAEIWEEEVIASLIDFIGDAIGAGCFEFFEASAGVKDLCV